MREGMLWLEWYWEGVDFYGGSGGLEWDGGGRAVDVC